MRNKLLMLYVFVGFLFYIFLVLFAGGLGLNVLSELGIFGLFFEFIITVSLWPLVTILMIVVMFGGR